MRLMISELQRQLSELDSNSSPSDEQQQIQLPVPPRRMNPFNRTFDVPQTRNRSKSPIVPPKPPKSPLPLPSTNRLPLRVAPPPPIARDTANIPINDDNELTMQEEFNFLTVHEYFGKSWMKVAKVRQEAKEKTEKPLIVF